MEKSARQKNIQNVLAILSHTYPHAKIVLRYHTPWELLVAVILSAQCTDVTVNKVTEKLFAKYRTLDDYVHANTNEFEKDIRSAGFYHAKAKNILSAAKIVGETFHGKVPKTMEDILTLPGVARKTANVVLGNAYRIVMGIAVDTHVIRLSQRLRLVPLEKIGGKKILYVPRDKEQGTRKTIDYIKDASPEKIETELMNVIPKAQWFSLTYRLIDHGRAVCKAQNPQCDKCPLSLLCPATRLEHPSA